MLRKATELPRAFLGNGCASGVARSLGGACRIHGGCAGVAGHVGGRGGVTGSAGGGAGGTFLGGAGGGVGGDGGGAGLAARDLTSRPGARGLDGCPGPVVARVLLLEEPEYVLGTVSGPQRKRPVVPLVEPLLSPGCDDLVQRLGNGPAGAVLLVGAMPGDALREGRVLRHRVLGMPARVEWHAAMIAPMWLAGDHVAGLGCGKASTSPV